MLFKIEVRRKHLGSYQLFLKNIHKVKQVLRLATTDVVYSIRRDGQAVLACAFCGSLTHHPYYSFYDIIYISKISSAVAIVINLDSLTFQQFVGEAKVGHVGATSRAIDGKETQAGAGDIVELAVAMGHQLVALLSGGIKADGIIYIIVCGEGNLLIAAIHATARSIHQMLHGMVAAGLKDIVETNDVALNVGIGVLDAVV